MDADEFFSRYYRCDVCDTIYDKDVYLTDYQQIHQDYSRFYSEFGVGIGSLMYFFSILDSVLISFHREYKRYSMLDVGAAAGFLVDIADFFGWKATGVEPDVHFSEWGRTNLGVDIRTCMLEGADLDTKYDAIVSSEVIEHVKNPLQFLNTISEHILPEGVLLLTTPNLDASLLQDAHNKKAKASIFHTLHIIIFSKRSLEKILKMAGFDHVVVFTEEHDDLRLIAVASKKTPVELPRILDSVPRTGSDKTVLKNLENYLEDRVRKFEQNIVWYGFANRLLPIYNSLEKKSDALRLGEKIETRLERDYTSSRIIENAKILMETDFGTVEKPYTKNVIFEVQKMLPIFAGEFYFNYGMARMQNKEYDEAKDLFARAVLVYKALEKASGVIWSSEDPQIDQGNLMLSVHDFRTMVLQSRYHIGLCELCSERRESAINIFEDILKERLIPQDLLERLLESTRNEVNFGEMKKDISYEQTIFSEKENLYRIDLKVATFMRNNTCDVTFILMDMEGKTLHTHTVSASKFKDNSFFPIMFESIADSKQKHYIIAIRSPNCSTGNSVTFWGEKTKSSEVMNVDKKKLEFSLIYKLFYKI